jgi:hypothetical protein
LLAGVLMKLVGMVVALIAFGVSFFWWYRTSTGSHPEEAFKREAVGN